MDRRTQLEKLLIGMTEEAAKAAIETEHPGQPPMTCRIAGRGGKSFGPTGAFDENRVNLDLRNGLVYRVSFG